MSRTVQDIEADIQATKADIQAIKDGNPNWFKDVGAMALIKLFNDLIIIKRGPASGPGIATKTYFSPQMKFCHHTNILSHI